ncbi:hypothetical protein GCM10027200_38960 [Lentzea nigeriaca]
MPDPDVEAVHQATGISAPRPRQHVIVLLEPTAGGPAHALVVAWMAGGPVLVERRSTGTSRRTRMRCGRED